MPSYNQGISIREDAAEFGSDLNRILYRMEETGGTGYIVQDAEGRWHRVDQVPQEGKYLEVRDDGRVMERLAGSSHYHVIRELRRGGGQ